MNLLNLIKNSYVKLTANITQNGEKQYVSPSDWWQSSISSFTIIQYFTRSPASVTKNEKKMYKDIQIGKEAIKLFLFAEDMLVYVENSKKSWENSWN